MKIREDQLCLLCSTFLEHVSVCLELYVLSGMLGLRRELHPHCLIDFHPPSLWMMVKSRWWFTHSH